MKPKGNKRVLAVLLAVCMVLFAVPFTTYAAEDTHTVKIIIANSDGSGLYNPCTVTLTEQSSGQEIVCNSQIWYGENQYFVQVPNGTYNVSCTINVGKEAVVQGSVEPIVVTGADENRRYRVYYTNFYDTLDTSYYGAKYTFSVLEKPQDPVKKGYIFKQWVTAKENGEPFDFNTALTKNMSLYADWEHDHSYGAEWKSDADNHWHECSCGEKKDNAAHIEGTGVITKAPTETEAGTKTYSCSVCGYVMRTESIPVLEHNYGDDWEKDTENHWHKCSNCGDKKDLAAHTWDQGEVTKEATCTEAGEKKYTCTVCDAVKKEVIPVLGHSYGSDWEKDTENHWHECGLCGDKKDLTAHTWNQGEVTKEATCTEAGEKKYTCTVCDAVKKEVIPVLGHSYGSDWEKDTENHWHECSLCGDKKDLTAHTWDQGEVTKEATCTEAGEKKYTCTVCDAVKKEVIPVLGHSYGSDWEKDTENHWHECSLCGDKKDLAAHTWDQGEVTKEATCTEAGEKKYTCTVCGAVKKEVIPVLGHSYGSDWEKDTENHWHECSLCGDKKDLAAHTWDQGEVTKEATCTEAGEKKYTCTVCDAVKKEVIPVLGHSYGSDWEKDTENHWHECGLCGDKKDLAVHTWDQGEVTKEAACTEAGEKKYTCTVCGVVKTEVIPVLAHSYGTDWEHDVENHWHECVFCGGKNERAAHIEGDGIVTKEPTAAGTGIKTYSCSVCGYEMRTESIPATGTGEIGTLQTEIERGNNVPSVQIPMSDSELADAVLTAEEKGSIKNGADVKILLTVENAAGSVSGEDKTVVEAVLGELTTGQYFDINLLKIINGVESKILETTGTIKITIAIPDSLKNSNRAKNREFVIIRVHDGKATILNDLDTDADTITIETDRFSTYALAYRDLVANNVNKNNGTGSKSDIPQTGDSTPLVHYAMVSMLAAGALMILLACRKRKGIQE